MEQTVLNTLDVILGHQQAFVAPAVLLIQYYNENNKKINEITGTFPSIIHNLFLCLHQHCIKTPQFLLRYILWNRLEKQRRT